MDAASTRDELRRLVAARPCSLAELRASLGAWADRHGLGPSLLRLVLHGPLADARVAALALREVSSEFVRRAVVKAAADPDEPRRALARVACRPAELPAEPADAAAEIEALAGLLATAPDVFVEWLADPRPELDLPLVEAIEAQRAALRLASASAWAPVLARRCTRDARERIHQLLGRAPGPAAQALLEREERRAATDDAARSARRERMRQSTLTAPDVRREGFATWSLGPGADVETVQVHEALPSGETLRTLLRLDGSDAVACWTEPAEQPGEPDLRDVRLSLGAVRSFLGGLPASRRRGLAPLLARLEEVEPEPLPRAVPGAPLEPEVARALVSEGAYAAWRALEAMPGWTTALLASGRDEPREAWPPRVEAIPDLARSRLDSHLASAASACAHRLHRFAAMLRLRADARAAGVAGEAFLAARGRVTPVLVAWAEAELARRLPWQAPLPLEYRDALRACLRSRVGDDLAALRTLDIAQAALEALARGHAAQPRWPGLPDVAELPLDGALGMAAAVATRLARADAGLWSEDAVAFELRGHGLLSDEARRSVTAFVLQGCRRECRRRCFARPAGEVEALLDGESPVTLDPLAPAPRRRVRRNS